MSFITGVGLTSFGRHEGSSSLDLMSKAAELAIADAGLKRSEIDGILCGYSTVAPHIMLATVFAEHFGIRPAYAHAVQVGGATGLAMTMLAHHLVEAGVVKHVLVVGGENRLTGQSRDASILALAQVGHPDYEVPLGPTIPAYYGLVASRYMHEYGVTQQDLAEFAVLMRRHALTHPGAQFHDAITVADVMASKPVALPLKLLDCCPVSDGGAAFVVSRERTGEAGVRVLGGAQAHTHQHVTAAPALSELGAEISIARAKADCGVAISDVRYAGVYDSFTITLAMLLEDLGLAGRGEAAAQVRAGHFSRDGAMPLNTHGGLLSYGHCGVGGAMAWSGCDERRQAHTRRLDHGRGSDRLSILRSLRELAIFSPQLLRGLRRTGPGGAARQRRGDGLRDLAGRARRHAGDPRARSLQYRSGRYR